LSANKELPPELKKRKIKQIEGDKITLRELLEGVYASMNTEEARNAAPHELKELRQHMDEFLSRSDAITEKVLKSRTKSEGGRRRKRG
jgi:uncharacterized coiled-coil DUF342 family protein